MNMLLWETREYNVFVGSSELSQRKYIAVIEMFFTASVVIGTLMRIFRLWLELIELARLRRLALHGLNFLFILFFGMSLIRPSVFR